MVYRPELQTVKRLYLVVSSDFVNDFELIVSKLILDGYKPVGGVFVAVSDRGGSVTHFTTDRITYYQAMMLDG